MNFEKKKTGLAAKISAAIVLGVGFMGVLPSVMPNSSVVSAEKITIDANNFNEFYDVQTKTLTIPAIKGDDTLSYNLSKDLKNEVEHVTILNGATTIPRDAFMFFTNLKSVTIPNSVTSIGDHAFEKCRNLTSVTIPEGVTSIGDHAFEGCRNLTSVTIPEGVTSIGRSAFAYCRNLTSVTIPENSNLKSIGDHAFAVCWNLTSVSIPTSVTSIGDHAFF